MSNGLVQLWLALERAFAPANVPAPEQEDRQSPRKRIDLTPQELADRLEAQITKELPGKSGVTVRVSSKGNIVVTCQASQLQKVYHARTEHYIFYPPNRYGKVEVITE